jgi:hypothetical protein
MDEADPNPIRKKPPPGWLAPRAMTEDVRRRRHTDVSQNPMYHHWGLFAAEGDFECKTAPRRMPEWVLPAEETYALFQAGHGTAPDLVYARGVPNSPSPDPTSFDKKQCTLVNPRRDRLI